MSGAEDLARLTGTIDILNEITISPEIKDVDVGNGETRPTVTKALSIAATQFGGAMPYTSIEEALTNTITGTVFSVPSKLATPADPLKYIDMYLNDGGVAVPLGDYPSGDALRGVEAMIRQTDEAVDYLNITDEEGGMRLAASSTRLKADFFELRLGEGFGIIDDEGGLPIYADAEKAYLGPLEVRYIDYPAVLVGNEEGEILTGFGAETVTINPLDAELVFSPVVAVAAGSPSKIYPQAMLSSRESAHLISAGLSSLSQQKSSVGEALEVSDAFGPEAVLTLRLKGSMDARASAKLSIKVAPAQENPLPLKVLLFADSIGNNQGGMFLKQFMEELGYAPTFIGTVNGSVDTTRFNADGPLGEARPGWEYGDYMFSKFDRALILAPGAEAEYLVMTKADKLSYNPFLRVATAGDDAAIVQSGHVFDVAFYQARFGLDVPDVVINAMGTNDSTTQPSSTIYATCLANDTIFNRQVAAAWPNTKVIRTIPTTGIDPMRSPIWTTKYTQIIRAAKVASEGYPKVSVAPLWAMMNPDQSFAMSTALAGSDGFTRGTWADPIHPIGASRQEYYKAMAPFVVVAALNL